MVVVDKREVFIVSTASHFFGVAVQNESIVRSPILQKFLDESTCRTLCAQPSDEETREVALKLSNDLLSGKNTLVFFKLAASIVTEENFHDLVQVTSTGGRESATFVEALRQVWAPTLRSSGLDPLFLRKLEENLLGPRAPCNLEEEERFWREKCEETSRPRERAAYEESIKILKNIRTELENAALNRLRSYTQNEFRSDDRKNVVVVDFKNFSNTSTNRDGFVALDESLEAIAGHVDDLWKIGNFVYTEDRMKLLLEIIGNEVAYLTESFIKEMNESANQTGDQAILMGAVTCEKWAKATEKLTTLFWPHHSLHPWKGGAFVSQRCSKISARLRQLAELRAQHRQLMRLLTADERKVVGMENLLRCFDDTRVIYGDHESDLQWNRLKRKVEEALVPAEKLVAQKLKAQFANATTPKSLLIEFQTYFDLMKRDRLKNAFHSEREALLSAYDDLIETFSTEPDTNNLLDSPRILQQIQSARSSEMRLESLNLIGKELLADLPKYKEIALKVAATLKEVERRKQNLVESWVSSTREMILTGELTLGTDSTVVELTGSSLMRVNYDPRLMTLIREARALSGQGVELPREVRNLVDRASSLAGRARALQQIATFHNTIGDRMVPSQRPLMLTTALELARAVKEQSGVVWSDPAAVDGYTNRLRELVNKFARQNAELASKHASLRDLVSKLFGSEAINLVGNQNIWKNILTNIRGIVDSVEVQYGNTKAWKLHWDRQLLKALTVAYKGALPSLLRKLPEIRVELIFRDGTLQWRPSLEEIRAKLYSAIRRSLSIPMNFRGVGETEQACFTDLVQKNAYLFGGVYKQAEILLIALQSVRTKWLHLATLARIDAGEKLKGAPPQEWTRAFKDAKQWAQEVGKLRGSEVKLWCISIDTGTTRNDLESASRRSWERLCSDLRVEASSRMVAIMEFLSSASKELDKRPRTVEEVGIANEMHERVGKQYDNMKEEMESVIGLAKILAAWTSEKLEGISSVYTAYQELAERLERHKSVLNHQLEDAKVNLRHKVVALRDEIERWETKWSAKSEVLTLEWILAMKERWITLTEQKDSLSVDCQRVGLDVGDIIEEDPELYKRLEAELEAEESNCRFQAEFLEELENQKSEEWAVARRRLPRLHDWLDSWENRIRLQSSNREIDTFVVKKIREIRDAVEWIQLIRGDEIAEEHWTELKPLLGLKDVQNVRDITLGDLLECKERLQENVDEVKSIAKRAVAESGIRQALLELESWENSASLQLLRSKDSKNAEITLVGEYGSLLGKTGELRLLLEGAKSATGYERFAARATRCEAALSELEERAKLLSAVQRKWIYLEPIYGSEAAPNDLAKWSRADKEFRYLMNEVSRDPRVTSVRRISLPALISLKDLLDRCQRSLDEFLEERRSAYPRLYFLSDEDLLELISGTGKALESHLPKLYQGVGTVSMEEHSLSAVISPEGEILKLLKLVNVSDPLPQWLCNLEEEIRSALRGGLDECLRDASPDPSAYPTQVLLLSERIKFTERCENAMKQGNVGLKKLLDVLESQRAKYRGLENVEDKLTVLKARGLLLDTVHHLEVCRSLLKCIEMGNSISWIWYRQLRTYQTKTGPVVRCAAAEFPYRFEYQGAAMGLVWTPLIEKCFLALTQAMKLGLGGSPTGPAGTGKTESVKALGAMLGRLVLVFNCDEGMDTGSMKRILGGLAQAGAWGCFDEFNRLEEETLSAMAMLVRPLQEAVRDSSPQVILADRRMKLDPHCCIFITMNPAGSEYAGRHKLPDSLARLFRPIGMAHPDKCDITRTLLECAGFLEASVLANRLVETFEISQNLLSRQPHYDWGLRALRSVLDAVSSATDLDETSRLLNAVKDSTLPKLTEEDTLKFLALLNDVFLTSKQVSSDTSSAEKEKLRKVLLDLCEPAQLTSNIVNRCLQLYDQLKARTGVAIIGPPGSGKTTVRKLLADAMTKVGESVNQYLIYPGAISKSRLLGRVDPRTREWKDGLLSSAVIAPTETRKWIIFNGDVEPEWVEALNSALDDNKLLTLPNGIGVKLTTATRFIFESHKLADASPATVSRLGVVHLGFLNHDHLFVQSRMEQFHCNIRNDIKSQVCACINEILRNDSSRYSASGLANSAICCLRRVSSRTASTEALLASFCSQIRDQNFKNNLARLIYQLTDCWCPNPSKPFDVFYNETVDRMEALEETHQLLKTDDGPVLLLAQMRRALPSLLAWIEEGYPVLLRGPSACGKSTLISAALSIIRGKNDAPSSSVVQTSSLYGSQDLVTRLKRACVRLDSSTSSSAAGANGRTYKARNGSRLVLILEDLHLASRDTQELIRQLIQEGGFHEEDVQFARVELSLISTADEDTELHPRLQAILATCHLINPTSKELQSIVELHLRNSTRTVDRSEKSMESWTPKAATVMLEAYPPPNPTFSWTPKDLVLWANCLRHYPVAEDELDISHHLFDAGRRLFYHKLALQDKTHWNSVLLDKLFHKRSIKSDVYVWKSGNSELMPLIEEEWKESVSNAAARCAREEEPVQAIITSNFLDIVSTICWIFGTSLRGMILTGRPGAGRKSAVKLATTYSSLRLITSAPGRARSSIKAAIQAAGIEGERTVLLLEEHHMAEEGLPILVRAIVAKGELPGLFSMEELDALVAPLMDFCRTEDFSGSLEQYLYNRLRSFLRIAIILDTGDLKSDWLGRSGLLKYCAIVASPPDEEWWSQKESLLQLATHKCSNEDGIRPSSEGITAIVKSHLHASKEEQAPARFLALLHTWQELRQNWTNEIDNKVSKLEAGVSRLREAGSHVAKLEDEVSRQRQDLEAEKKRANAALEQITATMRGATGQRGEMSTLKAETERESAELARRKADIEGELGKVEPLVAKASQAVAGISADALAEVRSLRAPPAAVRDVLEGVLRLMGIRDTSWNSMKTFLAKRGIKDEIKTWDARRSTPASLDAVSKLVRDRPDSFDEKTAKRASIAAAPLAAWVLANLKYGQILQQVAPLEREQRLLAERLAAAEAQIGKLASGLSSVESRVAQLQEELAEHSRGAAALQLRAEASEASLATARELLSKLDTEHQDWQLQLEELTKRKARLDVEAANAASLLVYRNTEKDDKWKKCVIESLISERERLLWRAQGLPVDTSSLVGAACALRGPLIPIFLDPSGVAVAWLKANVGSKLEIAKASDSKFLTSLELAVRFGKALLVEEIVEFPSILLPLLRKRPLRLGERVLAAQQGFKLFLATRRDHLDNVRREASAVLLEIALGAGSKSLAERLIDRILLNETPEIESRRRAALELEEKLSGEQETARSDLLAQLATARGQDLLQEREDSRSGGLLHSLETTQAKSKEIAVALEESRKSLEEISKRAESHEKMAIFAANIYKAVKELTFLSPLYVFSVEAFTNVYLEAEHSRSASAATRPEENDERHRVVRKKLIALTVHYCTRAAYRKHRLPLALHLAFSLFPLSEAEKKLLLESGTISEDEEEDKDDDCSFKVPKWVPEERRKAVRTLATAMPEVAAKMRATWLHEVGSIYSDNTLTPVQRILAIKAIRPDHLYTALSKFVTMQLGIRDLAPPAWCLQTIAEEENTGPVLLLLSPGADPGPELAALANRKIASATGFMEVSLGQGQVAQAELALEAACKNGSWLLLSNLHLALTWLPRLESLLRSATCSEHRNSTTRIWLTTEECAGFYPGLAALCLKLAYEPPEGVKRNIKRTFGQIQQRERVDAKRDTPENMTSLFLLSWLHAVLQERRKFVPQGWIKPYDWNEADLEAASVLVAKETIGKKSQNGVGDWEAGRGLLDVAIYGGRLQDEYDARALRSIIQEIWCKNVFEGRKMLVPGLNIVDISKSDSAMTVVDRLSDTDSPKEYFGLPANAERAWERAAAEGVLAILKGTMITEVSSGKKNVVKQGANIQKDLRELMERREIKLKVPKANKGEQLESPLTRFFVDEVRFCVELLKRIKSDIDVLDFVDIKTPKRWLIDWQWGPKDVLSFVNGLFHTYEWLEFLSKSAFTVALQLDLARLVRPQAFLAALKQHTARETKNSLESLQLCANWKENGKSEQWKVSVVLEGLLISGANIKEGNLVDLEANAAPITAAPICSIAFLPDQYSSGSRDHLDVPLYFDSQRNSLLCSLPVACSKEEYDVWLRRGVALYLRSNV